MLVLVNVNVLVNGVNIMLNHEKVDVDNVSIEFNNKNRFYAIARDSVIEGAAVIDVC